MNSNKSTKYSPPALPGHGKSKGAKKRRAAKQFANSMSISAQKGPGPALWARLEQRLNNSTGTPHLGGTSVGAAVSVSARRVGMSDMIGHVISWLVGYIYVGNGTLGATDSVYAADPSKTYTVVQGGTGYGANVPMAAADNLVGASYARDIIKHYARLRIRKVALDVVPLFPNTSSGMSVIVAPQRGRGSVGAVATDTTAALPYTDVLSMAGSKQCASWEKMSFDMTPFIAGGGGSAQNEFDTQTGQSTTTAVNNEVGSQLPTVPCTFAVSGNNSTSGLRGTTTHALIGVFVVDLIDFLGGNSVNEPVAVEGRLQTSILKRKTTPGFLSGEPDERVSKARSIATEIQIEQLTALPVTSVPMQQVLTAVRSDEEQAAIRRLEAEVRESLERRKAAELVRLRASKLATL